MPFIDAGTYSFDSSYRLSFDQITKAGGTIFAFQRIGNSRFSDSYYKGMRTPEMAEEDHRLKEQWETEFSTIEAQDHQRIGQSLLWHDKFNLQLNDFPCFVFVTQEGQRVGLLRIEHGWYESESSWRVFLRCFCPWLEQEDLRELAATDLENDAISRKLIPFTNKLTETVNKQLKGAVKKQRSTSTVPSIKQPPKKRAPRTAAIDALEMVLIEHIKAARDHAYSRIEMGLPPELLIRPTKTQLAAETRLNKWSVTRAFKDPNAHTLRMLWALADNLDEVLKYGRR